MRHETRDIRRNTKGEKRVIGHRTSDIGLLFILLCLVSCVLCLSSCFKEKPLAPPQASNGQTQVIEMGPDYTDQFFYSLETNTVLSHTSRFLYDLMFDCGANDFHVWLNTAKFMSLVRTDKTSLDGVTISDTAGHDFRYELGEFNVDSNTFGQWWTALSPEPVSAEKVYIINLGSDEQGNNLGFMKMKLNDFSNNSYSVTYANINSTDSATITVLKDGTRNYAYLSMMTNQTLTNIEPDKSLWDLCFTRYSIIFYEPTFTLPYIVTGVLHNPSKVEAYMDSTVIFDSVKLADFNSSRLLTQRDAIGYTWKLINTPETNAYYTMKFNYTYFIKAGPTLFYKLHFLDFYRNGQTGYPLFEYYQL